MTHPYRTPWHRASFDRFLQDRLPRLLAERLPLGGYQVEPAGPAACRITFSLAAAAGDVTIVYADLPQPNEEGFFEIAGRRLVVLPTAAQDELDQAEIRCVGEQLYDFVAARLGDGGADLPWDEALARAWFPLPQWMEEFLAQTAQELDETNWLSKHTHLRRLFLPDRQKMLTPGHFGRVCPIETPEGPNMGRFLVIAIGAEIQEGRLVVADARPEAAFGLSASMIPFLEHCEPTRPLMGANMLRQWMTPPDPEPALVQTGNEPAAPEFWCGRNLLTAYIAWGADTHEDAIVVSESAARRLAYPHPLEPGDKLSNRHGTKGVVSRILPDDQMPHLPDGTPVDLIFTFTGLISRLNFGQVREAVLSRLALSEGTPALAPLLHGPSAEELRRRLAQAGLPESGMETLSLGRGGKKLERPSAIGWVYWGKLFHTAAGKLQAAIAPETQRRRAGWEFDELAEPVFVAGSSSQYQADVDYYALRDLSAFETVREQFNTRSAEREDAATLAVRVAAGPVPQAGPPTPKFAALARRLQAAGIRIERRDDRVTFRFADPEGEPLPLAHPVPHPWLRERELRAVGAVPELAAYGALVEANRRMERMLASQAPDSLKQKALAELACRAEAFCDALLPPEAVRFGSHVLFSGRAVIAPGADLHVDQVGLSEEIAWTLFGPQVARETGDPEAARTRNAGAVHALDALMARSWVILNLYPYRSPGTVATAFLAFHPVRDPDHVLRLHPAVNHLMNADYDGDQIAVYLPVTEAGQREAGERLSVAGHLRRDPQLYRQMVHWHAANWGLARLSQTPKGRKEIETILGGPVAMLQGFLTKGDMTEALGALLEREGQERFFAALERLQQRGFAAVKESGASMNPFLGETLTPPPPPQSDDPETWRRYAAEVEERIMAHTDYTDNDLGVQMLSIRSGARGSRKLLNWFVGVPGIFLDIHGRPVIVRHGLAAGLTPEELFAVVVGAREGQARMMREYEEMEETLRAASGPRGFGVLTRAMRARYPGVVFARAAATGESDPLVDVDSRLFVGVS